MKKLLPAALALVLTTPALTADLVPQQFIGEWCADAKTPQTQPSKFEPEPKEIIYRRTRKCDAHVPEEVLSIGPDRLRVSDVADCKFLEITSVTRHGTHRLKFWCKQQPYGESWIYDIWVSVPGRNRIAIQKIEDDVR